MNVVREEAAVRDLAKAGLARGRCALDKVISRLRQTRTAPEQPFFGHVSLLSFGDRLDAAATELVLRVWQAWSYETAKTRAFRVALLHPVDPCCVEIVKVISLSQFAFNLSGWAWGVGCRIEPACWLHSVT